MDNKIKKVTQSKILSLCAAVGLTLYIFCAHFKYPFASTFFLYIGFLMAIILLVSNRTLNVSSNLTLFVIIIFMTFIGTLYTNNPERADRQATFFLIYFFLFWLAMQEYEFIYILKEWMYFFSVVGMLTVFIQFAFPTISNAILSQILRSDIYENVMWSFYVDGTFTGITSSVSMAAFSMAIVLFGAVQNILGLENSPKSKKLKESYPLPFKAINIGIVITALFGIILTSKRGIFVATIMALLLTLLLDKDISLSKLTKQQAAILCILTILAIVMGVYFISTNDYVLSFLKRFTGNNITTGRDVFYENATNDFSKGNVFQYLIGKGTASAYLINDTGLHNVYLQILYDHGLIGELIYVAFFIENLRSAVKNRYFYSMCMQIVFLVYCMSGNPLYDYYFFIPYLMFVCYKG